MKRQILELILKFLGKILSIFQLQDKLKAFGIKLYNKIFKKNVGMALNKEKNVNQQEISDQNNNSSGVQKKNKINANTPILFTVKSFATLMGSMLLLFYGFYQIVVIPRMTQNETHYKEMFDAQQLQNTEVNNKLNNIYNSVGNLNGVLQGMSMQNKIVDSNSNNELPLN